MSVYRERLSVPAWWWLVGAFSVLMWGSIVWAGLSVWVGLGVYAALSAGCAAWFLAWGRTEITVTGDQLRAGGATLPLAQSGQIAALDRAQTRELRGPSADPAAHLLIRPYLPQSVYIEVAGRPPGCPYWLIGTRRPAELAAAIDQARQHGRPAGACDDVGHGR